MATWTRSIESTTDCGSGESLKNSVLQLYKSVLIKDLLEDSQAFTPSDWVNFKFVLGLLYIKTNLKFNN